MEFKIGQRISEKTRIIILNSSTKDERRAIAEKNGCNYMSLEDAINGISRVSLRTQQSVFDCFELFNNNTIEQRRTINDLLKKTL